MLQEVKSYNGGSFVSVGAIYGSGRDLGDSLRLLSLDNHLERFCFGRVPEVVIASRMLSSLKRWVIRRLGSIL